MCINQNCSNCRRINLEMLNLYVKLLCLDILVYLIGFSDLQAT